MDAFDRFWQWANKPLESQLTIPAELHQAVMELAPEDRRDRGKVTRPQRSSTNDDRHRSLRRSARQVVLCSNGTSSWTVTPFGVLEATSMRPSS